MEPRNLHQIIRQYDIFYKTFTHDCKQLNFNISGQAESDSDSVCSENDDCLMRIEKDREKTERMNKSYLITYFESNKMVNKRTTELISITTEDMFTVDLSHFFSKFSPSREKFFLNIQGAIVKKLTKNLFVTNSKESKLIVADFSSMYSSIMDKFNVCTSSVYFFSQWPGMVNGKKVRIQDPNIFFISSVDIKICNTCVPIIMYIVKKDIYESLNAKIISSCRSNRKQTKSQMKKYSEDSFIYESLNMKQEFEKLLGNSFYGKQNDCTSPVYNPFCGSFVTKQGRGLLINLYTFLKQGTQNKLFFYYGDTDSVFISGNISNLTDLIDKFNKQEKYSGIIQVEIEKILDVACFFNKKNYFMLFENKIKLKGLLKNHKL